MKLVLAELVYAVSEALDCLEKYFFGITSNHSRRVSYMSSLMAEEMGIDERKRVLLTEAAALHDNALSEFFRDWASPAYEGEREMARLFFENAEKEKFDPLDYSKELPVWTENMLLQHCKNGEENMKLMPFYEEVKDVILYHHERADGYGPFKMKTEEIPLFSRLIHMADHLDVEFHLHEIPREKYDRVCAYVRDQIGVAFDREVAEAFLSSFTYERAQAMTGNKVRSLLMERLPHEKEEVTGRELKKIAGLFAKIIDYKSGFTCRHSLGIAEKSARMAEWYGWDQEAQDEMYFTGALHDLGKLMTSEDILEKPAKLTDEEYKEIKNHALGTYHILRTVTGLEEITLWASLHHEKLDGTGYPFCLKADDLGMKERLMACLDIYQALTEERPYKKGLSHEKTISMMKQNVEQGKLDGDLVRDLDRCFG
ncbi:MAG: HD domain-containing protein [Lachnospiraceae bacterium]|nr:HD domain-containing protein [Lachnospiraceae bacterium]